MMRPKTGGIINAIKSKVVDWFEWVSVVYVYNKPMGYSINVGFNVFAACYQTLWIEGFS